MKKHLKLVLLTIVGVLIVQRCLCAEVYAQDKTAKIGRILKDYQDQNALNGVVLVAEKGKVIYQNAFGLANFEFKVPNSIDTKFEIASLSKHITAVIILQLRDEGKLNLDDPIGRYLTDTLSKKTETISIRHLLTHTSGLTDHRFIDRYDKREGRYALSSDELVKFILEKELLFDPGTSWSYSNFGYNLLAIIAERITGKQFKELLKERIYLPAGMMNSTTLDQADIIASKANGYELENYTELTPGQYHDPLMQIGSGSIVTTAGDYFLYFKALTSGKLLSKESFKELITPKVYTEFRSNGKLQWSYTLTKDYFLKAKDTISVMYAAGNHYGAQAVVNHFYDDQTMVLVFINRVTRPTRMFAVADDISKILYGVEVSKPKDSQARLFAIDLKEKGFDDALAKLTTLRKLPDVTIALVPRDLNRLGYFYLYDLKKTETAIRVFKLNLELFPNDPGLTDSLGEAYFSAGKRDLAIETLKKAIELDPSNDHAKGLLKQLDGK